MLFLDGSALTAGPNSDVVLDEFVYDPASETGKLSISATKGVLRLVGGKISKNEPITLKTPTATIGIRGGIAVYDNGRVTFLFGKSMTVEAIQPDGTVGRVELVRPGTVTIGAGGQIGPVTPVSQQQVATTLGALEGSRGNSGGASEKPTEARVATATQALATSGSANAPAAVAPSPATASEGKAEAPLESAVEGALEIAVGDIGNISDSTAAAVTSDVNIVARFTPRPVTGVLLAGQVNSANTSVTLDRGGFGFVIGDTLTAFAPNAAESVVLPVGSGSFSVSSDATGGLLSGDGFVNDEGTFFFYRLRRVDDPLASALIFGGERNESLGVAFGDATVAPRFAAWRLIPGFPNDNRIALLPAPFGGNFGGAVASPLLAAFPSIDPSVNADGAGPRFLFAALAVNGTGSTPTRGPEQHSALVIGTGRGLVDQNPNNPTFDRAVLAGTRTFSVRLSATAEPIFMRDGLSSIFDANGFSLYGGPEEQPSFVLGSHLGSEAFGPGSSFVVPPNGYLAAHVALPAPELLPIDIGNQRSSRTLNGYAAGIATTDTFEIVPGSSRFQDFFFKSAFSSETSIGAPASNLIIVTDANTNNVAAWFRFTDLDTFQQFTLAFGGLNEADRFDSAFIDDRRFGAQQSAGNPTTVAGSNVLFSSTAMVSFDVVPNTGFFPPGAGPCVCKFVQWGFFSWDTLLLSSGSLTRTQGHINPWVAGELPELNTLPTTGTATYNGHAVGNVRDHAGNRYIAAGSYTQSWNFATRNGSATIANFDGRTLDTSSLGSANGRDFSGPLAIRQGPTTLAGSGGGAFSGSFVRGAGNPAAEVMGAFVFSESTGYRAAGIVAGSR
jgi:hypothetical protein